jgi:DNA replication protein DnaC
MKFTTQSKLLGQLQSAHATHTFERRFQALAKTDLLIIDDFGLKPIRSPQDEDFHDLIAERYERRASIITSNLDFPEWGEVFPNRLLGVATLDRLRHGAYRVILDGNSFRAPKPLPEKPKNTLAKGGEKA